MRKSLTFLLMSAGLATGLASAGALAAEESATLSEMAAGPSQTANAPLVEISVVAASQEELARRFPARVLSPSVVTLVPRVAGEITALRFKEGEPVKKGDVLFEIDRIRHAANVREAKGAVLQAQAELERAKSQHKRLQNLVKQKADTVENLEQAARDAKTAEGALEEAYAQLTLAEDDLKHATVKSPVDGRISAAQVTAGNYVKAEDGTLATIVVTNPMRVRFAAGMRTIASDFGSLEKLRENGRVSIMLADGSMLDQVSKIEFTENQAAQTTDTVDIYASFENADETLLAGSTVTAILSTAEPSHGTAVPLSAVMYDQKGAYVWVVDDDYKVTRRNIAIGRSGDDFQFVRRGLKAGERVVSEGMHKVAEGGSVNPNSEVHQLPEPKDENSSKSTDAIPDNTEANK